MRHGHNYICKKSAVFGDWNYFLNVVTKINYMFLLQGASSLPYPPPFFSIYEDLKVLKLTRTLSCVNTDAEQLIRNHLSRYIQRKTHVQYKKHSNCSHNHREEQIVLQVRKLLKDRDLRTKFEADILTGSWPSFRHRVTEECEGKGREVGCRSQGDRKTRGRGWAGNVEQKRHQHCED